MKTTSPWSCCDDGDAMETTQQTVETARKRGSRAGVRKVTYSLPARLVAELDRRTATADSSKSAVVAEALALYFAEKDREALAKIYREAAQDPLFMADNEVVLRDFAALDAEVDEEIG
jgi:hypothetical protein